MPSPNDPNPAPMVPSNALVTAANRALADKDFRDSVQQMHAQNYPLVKMVEALGLEADMSDRIREILVSLPDDTVDEIRRATLAMLGGAGYTMPLDCSVTDSELDAGVPVAIDVVDENGVATIQVRRDDSD
jgi:hypothetical protein